MKALWNRSFFPVLLTYFIDNFGLAIVYPIFTPLFLQPQQHFLGTHLPFFHRMFFLGLMIASFPLAQFFGAPLLGALSDRVGRKKVFLGTICGGIIGYSMTGFGIRFQMLSILWIGRALAGFFAGNLTLALAAIADRSFSKKERAHNFGWVGAISGIAFVLAILTGAALSNPHLFIFSHPEFPFLLTAVFLCVNLILMWKYFKEKEMHTLDLGYFSRGVKNIGAALKLKEARPLFASYFLFMLCWFSSLQFLSTYLTKLYRISQNGITFTFVMIGAVWALANFFINPLLAKRFVPKLTFQISLFGLAIFLLFTLLPHQPLPIFLFHFVMAALFGGLSWTSGLTTISLAASKFLQGSILGLNQALIASACIIGPLIGGVLVGIDVHVLYIFTGLCSLGAALLLFKK